MTQRYYISVILPLRLEWAPCYWTTENMNIGDRVRVNFAGKEYIGVVQGIDTVPQIDEGRIREIVKIEKNMERILTKEIELWKRVAEYYLCSVGDVYKAAYPSGKINTEHARAEAKRKVCERRARTLKAITDKMEKLQGRLEKKTLLAENSKEGTKTRAAYLAEIININEELDRIEAAREAAEASLMAAENGYISVSAYSSEELIRSDTVKLSPAQEKAADQIIEGFKAGKPVLLHGITGSGKTEIYIKLAQKILKQGKNVLYLVPEIALGRQLEDRLHEHFGDFLHTFHSGESLSSRRNSVEAVRNGSYIALCTRSGIFLPHHDLGLIIVDEEHDSSYKQDSPAPRYNGRDTALMMSTLHEGCNIILGSATPSLEEIYNTNAGRHIKVELNERFHGSDDSDIEIIDTKSERKKNGMAGNFSRKLIDRIREALQRGEQVLLLRSRKAWSSALQCAECGTIIRCPHCNVSLSYHKIGNSLICHYCGHRESYPGICIKCGGHLNYLGAGTQKIEEEAAALFPEAKIARLDGDTAQNKAYETKIIKEFSKGEIDILIGTQIITKGFDFKGLSLVAIIAADTLLGIQDFRADEKALHLIEQFRGRSGRRGEKGRLVIQTSQPEHPVYLQLRNPKNVSKTDLLMERREFGFPPFSRIIELTVKDIYEDRLERMSVALADRLEKDFVMNGTDSFKETTMTAQPVTPPYRPVVDRIADQHIRKIRICLKKDRHLVQNKKRLKDTIACFEKEKRYDGHIVIDVDPS